MLYYTIAVISPYGMIINDVTHLPENIMQLVDKNLNHYKGKTCIQILVQDTTDYV